ncbi:MAG: hypothetical protein OTI35_14105 [Sulfitobacter sp.]|nr:hypothetical protein [Sulfitobacter sp.]
MSCETHWEAPSDEIQAGIVDFWRKLFAFDSIDHAEERSKELAFHHAVASGEVSLESRQITDAVIGKKQGFREFLFMSADENSAVRFPQGVAPKKYHLVFALHSVFGIVSQDYLRRVEKLFEKA